MLSKEQVDLLTELQPVISRYRQLDILTDDQILQCLYSVAVGINMTKRKPLPGVPAKKIYELDEKSGEVKTSDV